MPAPRRDRHPLAERHRACAATLKDPLAQGRAAPEKELSDGMGQKKAAG